MRDLLAPLKAAMAKFAAAFWAGFEQARAQPAPANPFESEAVKAALVDVVKAAFADGMAAERKRVSEVLNAPGAALFPTITADLLLGPATSAQAAGVLERASADAATRAGLMKSSPLENASNQSPTFH